MVINSESLKNGEGVGGGNNSKVTHFEGEPWIEKNNTSLNGALNEVFSQKLAQEVLGKENAPETQIDGSSGRAKVFSKVAKGESRSLDEFLDAVDSGDEKSKELLDKNIDSLQNSFLDAVAFKVVSGDSDINLGNFIVKQSDEGKMSVMPIDGENSYDFDNIDKDAFNELIKKPKEMGENSLLNVDTMADPKILDPLLEGVTSEKMLDSISSVSSKIISNPTEYGSEKVDKVWTDVVQEAGQTYTENAFGDVAQMQNQIDSRLEKSIKTASAYKQEADRFKAENPEISQKKSSVSELSADNKQELSQISKSLKGGGMEYKESKGNSKEADVAQFSKSAEQDNSKGRF